MRNNLGLRNEFKWIGTNYFISMVDHTLKFRDLIILSLNIDNRQDKFDKFFMFSQLFKGKQ